MNVRDKADLWYLLDVALVLLICPLLYYTLFKFHLVKEKYVMREYRLCSVRLHRDFMILLLFFIWLIVKKCIEKKVESQATSAILKKVENKVIDKVEEKIEEKVKEKINEDVYLAEDDKEKQSSLGEKIGNKAADKAANKAAGVLVNKALGK